MRRKLIPMFCIVAMIAAAASAQTAQAPPKTTSPPAAPGPARNAAPSPEVQRLAAQISDYATAQCGGADADAATDCRVKALWAATQCREQMAAASTELKTGSSNCTIHDPGFEYEVSSIKPHKNDGDSRATFNYTPYGLRATNMQMITLVSVAYAVGPEMKVTGEPAWTDEL